jgi:hypothetical protein
LYIPIELLFGSYLIVVSPICSQTEDAAHYRVYDKDIGNENDFFLLTIPQSVSDIRYYYCFSDCIDPMYDVVAEWKFNNEEDYAQEKQRVGGLEAVKTEDKGAYSCIYFNEENGLNSHTYFYKFFAYDDDTMTVRYIMAYCMDSADGIYKPYFDGMEW